MWKTNEMFPAPLPYSTDEIEIEVNLCDVGAAEVALRPYADSEDMITMRATYTYDCDGYQGVDRAVVVEPGSGITALVLSGHELYTLLWDLLDREAEAACAQNLINEALS